MRADSHSRITRRQARILEGRDEAIDRLGALLAALIEAGDIGEIEVEGAEFVAAREMRRDREEIVVRLFGIFEHVDALGQKNHLPAISG